MTDILFYIQFPDDETAKQILITLDTFIKVMSKGDITNECNPLIIDGGQSPGLVHLEEQHISNYYVLLAKILDSVGMNKNCCGYKYIIESCMYMHINNRIDCLITKDIYPMLAAKNNVSTSSIEQAMRNVIKRGWDTRNTCLESGHNLWNGFNRRPSNKEFINRMIEITGREFNLGNYV